MKGLIFPYSTIRTRRNQQLPTQEINKSQGKLIILQSAEDKIQIDPVGQELDTPFNPFDCTDFQLMNRMFRLIKLNLKTPHHDQFEDLFWEMYDRFIVEPADRQTALQQVINRRRC